MKITKFEHSCLLVEENGSAILIDPGVYSEGALDIDALPELQLILITHEHADHFHIPLLKQILEKKNNTPIISNESVAALLQKEGLQATSGSTEEILIETAPHEKILGHEVENISFTLFNKLTHPGDSLHFSKTAEILALPIQAPWGSMVGAIEKAVELRPKIIVPIHDWHWKDEARTGLYQMAKGYFSQHSIDFKTIDPVGMIEI